MVPNAESRAVALVAAAFFWWTPVAWAATPCDPGLPTAPQDPLAYRERADRCEGRYVREVSGSPLVVASFAEPLPAVGSLATAAIELAWSAPAAAVAGAGAEVRLRAQSLRRRVYYRMDAVRPAVPAVYRWPRDVAAALVPKADDLGIVASAAWTAQRELLLPVRLAGARADRYELMLIPGTEWRELRYTLSRVDAAGQAGPALVADKPLGYGYYPAERAVALPLGKALLGAPGLFRLDIEAQLEGGGSVARRLWFVHAEAP